MTPTIPQAIEHQPIDGLIPYARNSRTHSPEQIAQVAASIREFGFTNPVLIDQGGEIIAGHGRVMAARSIGLAEVPCIRLAHLTEAQKRAYVIADNKLALNAGWDNDLLAQELRDLAALDFDLDLTGFGADELEDLLGELDADGAEGEELGDAEAVPEPRPNAISRLGDVWILGKHRVMCGNSMKSGDVGRLMGGERADMVFTDPPYGVAYVGSSASKSIAGDITQAAIPIAFKHAIEIATREHARLYFCGGASNVQMYYGLFDAYLRSAPAMLIWVKENMVLRRNNYHSQFEVIYFGWKGEGRCKEMWFSGRTLDEASDVWRVKRDPRLSYEHPTQKPVELPARAMRNSCPPSGLIYEPFSGSGSTLIAAEQSGRICYAMELDPHYVDVGVRRWQNFTGQRAIHAETGDPFPEAPQTA
ncbi:site-specific DNA-methyltransferase [Thauera sp.]|uniref:site-specific DNA-methyltransferase n=1 Tax=Thauera sp. TaxID=1905334 RepID=UPI0039E3E824